MHQRQLYSAVAVLFVMAWPTFAQTRDGAAEKEKPIKATFLITGLHCPPCTTTVEQGLTRVKGLKSAKVSWQTKNALVEFDESQISAQQVAAVIARTPHMMGNNMQYSGWLALKVDGVKDDATAAKAKEAIRGVKGVSKVAVYPGQQAVGVAFAPDGKVTSGELIEALKSAGLTAKNYP